jgi:hypothetical protein
MSETVSRRRRGGSLAVARRLATTHWILLALIGVGVALRGLTMFAYRPAFMFFGDSFAYIIGAQRFQPPNDRPFGYSAVLRAVSYVGDLGLVVLIQHAAGVALAVVVYAALFRRGAPPWLAALATSPLLLDAYLIQIEHNILSETMFAVLLVGAVVAATRQPFTPAWGLLAGALLSAAALTRTVAIPIAALFVGYLLVRRVGWRPIMAFGAAMAIPVLAYMGWFASVYGMFGTTDASGRFLYGRVAVFSDCTGVSLTPNEAKLCDNAAPEFRPNANFYVWSGDSPVRSLGLPGNGNDQVAQSFSRKIILDQPLTYAQYALTDTAHYFAPGRYLTRVDSPDTPWRFPTSAATSNGNTSVAHNNLDGVPVDPVVSATSADFLRAYQSVVYTQGPILLLGLVLGMAAGYLDRGRRRWDGPFAAAVGLAVIAIPSLTVMFDYRYGLPAIPLLAFAGGIGGIAVRARVLARQAARAAVEDAQTAVESAQPARGHRARGHARPRPTRPLLAPGILAGTAVSLMAVVTFAPMSASAAYERYVSSRAELGPLGPPLGPPRPVAELDGLTEQPFVAGSIVSTSDQAVAMPQRYRLEVEEIGGFDVIGAPRGREQSSTYESGLRLLPFDNGMIFWSRLDGARAVYGDMYEAWSPKKVRARLKQPIDDVQAVAEGAAIQRFAGGTITRFADGSVRINVEPAKPLTGTDNTAPRPGDSANEPL